jgi:hypothetical protein
LPRISYVERLDRFDELLGEAKARSDADLALVGLLGNGVFDLLSRLHVVAALGDTTGPDGSAALRSEFNAARAEWETTKPRRSWYVDLMCACVWALGKRDGSSGTEVFLEAAAHANRAVRDYGLVALAAVGDDRAWEDMLAALAGRLAKKITSAQRSGEELMIIEYLARHCGRNADRRARLAGLIRERWSRVLDVEIVAQRYPGVGPDGPPPAEIDFRTYVPPAPWGRPIMAGGPPTGRVLSSGGTADPGGTP